MKKLLLLALLVVGTVAYGKEVTEKTHKYTVHPRVGVGIWNDYHADTTSVDGDGASFEAGVELLREIKPNLQAGIGFAYNNLADGDTKMLNKNIGEYKDYKSYPLYLTARYSFPVVGDGVTPYVKADLGYAFNGRVKYDIDGVGEGKEGVDNGLYAGIGAGIEQNNISVDMMFKTTQGEINGEDVDNYRVTLSVGYNFDFEF